MSRNIYYVAGLFALLLLAGGSTKLPAASFINEISMNGDSIVAAKELYDAFKKDADAAIKEYSDRTVTIKGFVVYTGPDVYALPSVELSEKKGGKSRILCVLPFSDYLKLRKVSKGDEVLIKGQTRAFYEKGDQVVVKQCEIYRVLSQ